MHGFKSQIQVSQAGYASEHVWVGGEAIAAGLAMRLSQRLPRVRAVAITPGGCLVESPAGRIDGRLETQLARLTAALLAARRAPVEAC